MEKTSTAFKRANSNKSGFINEYIMIVSDYVDVINYANLFIHDLIMVINECVDDKSGLIKSL